MTKDDFQTPPEALVPLRPYLPCYWNYWEPACGKGNLVNWLRWRGYRVAASDRAMEERSILGSRVDFLADRDSEAYKNLLGWADIIVTNPPYSVLDKWLARCFEIGKPFALLLPLTALGGKRRQAMYRQQGGVSVIMLGERLVMETPTGKTGAQSNPQFDVCWLCWNLPALPNGRIVFTEMPRCP